MADKKITALSVASEAATEDLLHIIDDPGGSPINKRISVKALLANVTHSTIGTAIATQEVLLNLTHTANAIYSTTANEYNNSTTLQIVAEATGGATGSGNQATVNNFFAADITNKVNNEFTIIKTETAGMRLTLDRGAEGASTVNSYALILRHANTAVANEVAPTAYMKIQDDSTGTGNDTSFIFDVYPRAPFGATAGAAVVAGPASSGFLCTTAGGWLKVKVLGQTRYIQLYAAGATS